MISCLNIMQSASCLACILLLLCCTQNNAFLQWLFPSAGGDTEEETALSAPVPSEAVPFEMKIQDEKFLMEAQLGKELSQLDFCHHAVIVRLQSTCGDLSEEELAKLSVQLLNCQSHAENRPIFPCTWEMSIAECTQDMDPTTWNAYQIVSNRARAICYEKRQVQFSMKTEHSVNQLVHVTLEQLDAMRLIAEGQSQIRDATGDTLKKMAEGQQEIMARQLSLRNSQQSVQSSLAQNLRDLFREKALITSGNKQLAEMTDSIKQKLDTATAQLEAQEKVQRANHDEILGDLATIRDKAKEVWNKIDNSSQDVLGYHNKTTEHYKETMMNLKRVNHSVAQVVTSIEELQSMLEKKLGWIAAYLGGTGDRVAVLSTVILHVLYFVLATISASFLRTPMTSRLVLLVIVPLNAWTEIKQGRSLGFTAMTAFIAVSVMLNYTIAWLWYMSVSRRVQPKAIPPGKEDLSPVPVNGSVTSPSGTSGDEGHTERKITTPDLKRLATILEEMCTKNGTPLTEAEVKKEVSAKVEDISLLGAKTSSANTSECLDGEENMDDKENLCPNMEPTPKHLPPTPMPEEEGFSLNNSIPLGSVKNRADMVKRRLLNSPIAVSPGGTPISPPVSRSSTPLGKVTPGSNQKRRSGSPSRPLCQGFTKSGKPCRNMQAEHSLYCHRHNKDKDVTM